jgi:fibro-slime domain-containing protein
MVLRLRALGAECDEMAETPTLLTIALSALLFSSGFDDDTFFPIDDQGFGNEGRENNFHFTTELHMKFRYKGGELFSFTGNDDLWVFVNDRLAIDLGGLHSAQTDVIDLDARAVELGIALGNEYALDLFHAERHTNASKFMVQSTLEFTNCDPIVY